MPPNRTTNKSAAKTDLPDDAVRTVVKRNRGAFPTEDSNIQTEPGDNAKYIRFAMASWNLPPIDISDPNQVQNRIAEYFDFCQQNDRKPQIVGMANWLGISRDTLNSWKRGEYRKETHSDIVQKAVSVLEEMWADYMLNGKVNPASGIFVSKNWFGYKDVQDVVVTPNNPLESENAEELKKYINALPEIAEDGE